MGGQETKKGGEESRDVRWLRVVGHEDQVGINNSQGSPQMCSRLRALSLGATRICVGKERHPHLSKFRCRRAGTSASEEVFFLRTWELLPSGVTAGPRFLAAP